MRQHTQSTNPGAGRVSEAEAAIDPTEAGGSSRESTLECKGSQWITFMITITLCDIIGGI